MQENTVIACVGMVLMNEPIAGTNMKFDIANRVDFFLREM